MVTQDSAQVPPPSPSSQSGHSGQSGKPGPSVSSGSADPSRAAAADVAAVRAAVAAIHDVRPPTRWPALIVLGSVLLTSTISILAHFYYFGR